MMILAIAWFMAVMLLAGVIAIGKTHLLGFEIIGINLRYLGFFVVGIGVAPLGLILARNRTVALQEQTDNDRLRRIGEEFSRSVGLLKDNTTAQGGIYALGALAKENKEMHETVIKIIASYIREKTKEISEKTKENTSSVDIEAALSVIKNRAKGIKNLENWEPLPEGDGTYVFDLSESSIRNGDLSNTRLAKVNLSQIEATDCVFANTDFSKANMLAAKFKGCDFTNAIFKETELNEAIFSQINDKERCDFKGADFSEADLSDADLSSAINLTQEQINVAKCSLKTKLPDGIQRPGSFQPTPPTPSGASGQ